MNIGVVSLGCVKNRVDTEQMLSVLTQAGHIFTPDPAEADIIIVNTCGFIDPAKEESIQTILEMAGYKQNGRCKKLIVTGCLAQRYGDALLQDMPEIDALLGVSQYDRITEAVESVMAGQRPDYRQRRWDMLECGRVLTTPSYSAYVRIGEGCDNRCAYCAIPLIRGGYRSRDEQAILDEAAELAANGARELILISQDTTRYGRDNGRSLEALMAKVAAIPGVEWLRALYMYPDETPYSLLDEMARHDNICKYLDLPLQHASNRILKAMNRRGTIEEAEALLTRAREMGFTLRTTFIVGHNLVGSAGTVRIEVFDSSGRLLWQHVDNTAATPTAYTYSWDLCTSTGAKLQTGVYLYRISVSVDGSVEKSKTKKLIVIGNN